MSGRHALLSHDTTLVGFSFLQTLHLLKVFGGVLPHMEIVLWVSENVVAFSVVVRCEPGASHWHSQRDPRQVY